MSNHIYSAVGGVLSDASLITECAKDSRREFLELSGGNGASQLLEHEVLRLPVYALCPRFIDDIVFR